MLSALYPCQVTCCQLLLASLAPIKPLVTKYGQTPAEVLQHCPPISTFALEPESSSSRPLQALCYGWCDAPTLRRAVPEQTQQVADKAAETIRCRGSQLFQEVTV